MPTETGQFRLPDLGALPGDERVEAMDALLRRATEEGVVPDLPASEEEVQDRPHSPSRVLCARTWLYLLGYLGKKSQDVPEIDQRLRDAIRRFQTDARITVDGWIGEETWGALEQLVSFETPIAAGEWMEGDGTPKPALARAVNARLHVLGFCKSRQPKKASKVRKALEDFAVVAEILGLSGGRPTPAIVPGTVEVLFDQDRILGRLGRADDSFSIVRPPDVKKARADRLIRKFVICVAKVELFLHGFDVRPDGQTKFESPDRSPYLAADYPLYEAMKTFWVQQGDPDTKAGEKARTVTGELFRSLAALEDGEQPVSDEKQMERLIEEVESADESERRGIWDHVRKIGARIWDGVRRAFRWFWRLIKRGLKKVMSWARNIARLLGRHARRVIRIMKKIFALMKDAVRFLFQDQVPGSDAAHIVIDPDADHDYRIYLAPGADREYVRTVVDDFRRQADRFRLAVRIVGGLITTVIDVAKKVALGGWLGLVVALVKIFPKVKDLCRQLDALPAPAA